MYLFGCTRACVYICDGDAICVRHDQNRCLLLLVSVYSPFSDRVGVV